MPDHDRSHDIDITDYHRHVNDHIAAHHRLVEQFFDIVDAAAMPGRTMRDEPEHSTDYLDDDTLADDGVPYIYDDDDVRADDLIHIDDDFPDYVLVRRDDFNDFVAVINDLVAAIDDHDDHDDVPADVILAARKLVDHIDHHDDDAP